MTAQLQRQTEKPTTNIGLAKVGRSAKFELTEFLFPICTKPQIVAEARLALAVATKTVIKNGLTILGVSAPERIQNPNGIRIQYLMLYLGVINRRFLLR